MVPPRARSRDRTRVTAMLIAAAFLCALAPPAQAGPLQLGGEGPLLPRSSGPRSSRTLVPAAEETAVPAERSEVLKAAGTEDEREGAAPEEATSTLRAFLNEMLEQGALWKVLPIHMGVAARRTYLEDRSIRSYREGIFRFPDSPFVPAAHLRIASIYARRGDRRAALREYATLLERFPDHDSADDARLARAQMMFAAGDYAGARDEGYLLMDRYTESVLVADAYLLVARAHELLGEFEEGQLAYMHVLERTAAGDERSVRACEGLASLELASGNAERGIKIYKQLLEEAPTQAARDAREFKLASVYLDVGETVRARMLFRRILRGYELNAYRAAAAFLLADSYYADGKMPQAAQYYTGAVLDFPTFEERIPALFRAADAYKELVLYEEALAMVCQVAKARDPAPTPHQRARGKLIAGEILFFDEQYGAALEELYGALVGELTTSERERAAYRIGQCYYRSGYYNEALEAFDAALGQAPQHELAFEALQAVADCYEKKGWLDDARQRYKAILDAASEDDSPEQLAARSSVVFRLLNTYDDRGLYQEELNAARELLERKHAFLDEARLLYRMARAYERLNNPVEAETLYAQVRSRFPGSTWAQQADVKIRHMRMLKQIKALSN